MALLSTFVSAVIQTGKRRSDRRCAKDRFLEATAQLRGAEGHAETTEDSRGKARRPPRRNRAAREPLQAEACGSRRAKKVAVASSLHRQFVEPYERGGNTSRAYRSRAESG